MRRPIKATLLHLRCGIALLAATLVFLETHPLLAKASRIEVDTEIIGWNGDLLRCSA